LLMLGAPACIAAPQVGGRTEEGGSLPQGVKAVWDVDKAYRESTPTRERLCINGLWRWQPAAGVGETAPETGWGYLRVPENWPGGGQGSRDRTVFFANPDWTQKDLAGVTAAWQQREVTVPREWNGRRIGLTADYVNSYAAVYVDGKKAGEIRFPAGELDLTALCRPGTKHTISMLVMALPLKGVMLSFSDSAAARQVEGRVARRGLCGDVYLVSTPAGPRITGVKVETSVRRWQITFEAALAALDPQGRYTLRAVIKDGTREVARFASRPFGVADLINGRTAITENWRPEKLWDTVTPNQYDLSVSLVDARAVTLDEALPVRFGFREFWIEGRDFYLNGSRIYLAALPIDNGQQSPAQASYDGTRATIQRFKSFGINFVYTHNYGCEPGTHLNFEEVLRAADDEGMLVSFSQPHFGQYDWTTADAETSNSYAQHAEFYVRVAQNHPSVVCYSTSHNSCGYGEDMNPDMIDGIQSPRDPWALKNTSLALRAEAIIRRLDPSRFVYHHASGNLGTMHAINFYANWAPIQEMNEWFEHWATVGVKPVFTCEYAVPFMWDWAMYRGWYKGKREFGSAVAPWEFCVAEWNAQFLGARSYDIIEAEKANLRWEAEQFRKGRAWQRYDYPYNLNSQVFDERFRVVAMYLADNFRAFRTWGVSATSPWDYGGYWKTPASARATDLGTEIDWDKLQRPGPRPVYVQEQQAKDKLAFRPSATEPTVAAQALYRNYMPLLAYLGGKPAAFTSKDHNFLPGEAVEKQLIAINNSRRHVTGDCEWSLGTPGATTASGKVALATGEQQRIPLKFQLPADLAPGSYDLRARVRFDNGETQEDTLPIHVMARPAAPRASAKIALFDPKGDTAKALAAMGVRCATVEAGADLASYDTLIVGKGALTSDGLGPDIARVREGLKVIVFEQTGEVLEKRFGFRIAEYGMRTVFRRVPDHPLLAGIGEEHLRDWHGEATILPPRLSYERPAIFNYVPTVKWSGIPVTQRWRCGHRGSVASALIEKPACGDFLPVLDCGYALQYSPLLEYREGKGMVLFCQADVNGRTETDPAAAALARNILDYAAGWKAAVARNVVYAGDPAGRRYLQSAGVAAAAYAGGGLSDGQGLVVGPGGGRELSASAAALASWVRGGGHVLAIGLDQEEANAFLPFHVATVNKEHIAQYFEPFGADSPFAGISPAEVHNRDPRTLPLVAAGAAVVGNGVLAKADSANVVFSQLAPWQFDYSGEKMNVKRTFRRVACLTARLLANMGAAGGTPLLARFANPANAAEKRWLDGLYLDAPEEWDDPYRFFRW
jgi:beta-galactosidase